jgi:hypothetical protein
MHKSLTRQCLWWTWEVQKPAIIKDSWHMGYKIKGDGTGLNILLPARCNYVTQLHHSTMLWYQNRLPRKETDHTWNSTHTSFSSCRITFKLLCVLGQEENSYKVLVLGAHCFPAYRPLLSLIPYKSAFWNQEFCHHVGMNAFPEMCFEFYKCSVWFQESNSKEPSP